MVMRIGPAAARVTTIRIRVPTIGGHEVSRLWGLHLTGVLPPRRPTLALVTDRKIPSAQADPGTRLTCVAPDKWRPPSR
jgi:hypothetical protein